MHPDPDLIVIFGGAFLLIVGYTLSRAFARRVENPPPSAELEVVLRRIENLERGIEALAVEMERNSESQRFIAKLLADENAVPRALPRA